MPPTAREAIELGFTWGAVAQPAAARAKSAATSATGLPAVRPRIGGLLLRARRPGASWRSRPGTPPRPTGKKPPDEYPRRPGHMLPRAPRLDPHLGRWEAQWEESVYPLWAG